MDGLMRMMRQTHHDAMNTSMFDAEAYMAHNYMDFFTHSHVSAGFDGVLVVVVDHLSRMAHFFPCTRETTARRLLNCFYKACTVCMAFRVCWLAIETHDLSLHFGKHFGDT
jgi:hypothetical protein